MGGAPLGITVTDDALEAFSKAQAVVDFTAPAATVEFAALAAQARAVHVIGTTGLEPEHIAKIEAAARHAVIIRAGNMSLGLNLLVRLTQKGTARLGPMNFDFVSVRRFACGMSNTMPWRAAARN